MNMLRETCHCGHDKATHYLDLAAVPPASLSCLACSCACSAYVNEYEPKPVARLVRPAHPWSCECARCKAYQKENAPKLNTPLLPTP